MTTKKVLMEGAVIVASILFAFAIDAGWDEYRERLEEADILDALEIEYRANLELAARVAQGHVDFRTAVEEMVERTDEEIRALPQRDLSWFVMSLCQPWTFDGVLGTTDALIGAGKLDLLSLPSLRTALTTFLNRISDLREETDLLLYDSRNVWKAVIDVGGPWSDPETEAGTLKKAIEVPAFLSPPTADDVIRIREDRTLMARVKFCHLNVGYYLAELDVLQEAATEVLEQIEASR